MPRSHRCPNPCEKKIAKIQLFPVALCIVPLLSWRTVVAQQSPTAQLPKPNTQLNMKLRTLAPTLALGLALGSSANAGTAVEPLPPGPVGPAHGVTVESELAVNYSSIYEFRGFDEGDHLVDTTLGTSLLFDNGLSLLLGAWYASLAQDDFTELNLTAGLAFDTGPVIIEGGYTWYYFPRSGGDANEIYFSVYSHDLIPTEGHSLVVGGYSAWDFETDGAYLKAGGVYGLDLAPEVTLELSSGISYNYEYYIPNDGFNNIYAQVALPVALTETATFTPYFRASWAIDALSDAGEGDIYLGGASLSVTF